MVDNRSAGFFGIGGGFNFKSGDISGTAAKTSDDKMGQGTEYFATHKGEEEQNQFNQAPFVDRSAQLNATLNSLAMMNVANIIKKTNKKSLNDTDIDDSEENDKISSEDTLDDNDDFLYVD